MAFIRKVGVYEEKNRKRDEELLQKYLDGGGKVHKIPDSRELDKIRKSRVRMEKGGRIPLFSEKEIFEK